LTEAILGQQAGSESIEQLKPALFYVLALLTAGAAWAVVASGNIVRMAVYLLLTLMGVAGLYFLLQAELPAAIQLIVYAGGTLILIVFGVMLTSRDPAAQLITPVGERVAGLLVAVAIAGVLIVAMAASALPAAEVAQGPGGYGRVALFGQMLLSRHLVAFELAGVLLLVVMIAAAYMARRRRG